MVPCPVVALIVPDRAHDGDFVRHFRKLCQMLGKLHAGDAGFDRSELAADFLGGFGLGVEGFVMRRPAVEPHQNAALGLGFLRRLRFPRLSPQPEQIDQTAAQNCSQPELQTIAASGAFTVFVWGHGGFLWGGRNVGGHFNHSLYGDNLKILNDTISSLANPFRLGLTSELKPFSQLIRMSRRNCYVIQRIDHLDKPMVFMVIIYDLNSQDPLLVLW